MNKIKFSSIIGKTLAIGILSIFVMFNCPCSLQAQTSANSVEILGKVALKLKWRHQFQFAGYYAALERGFYKEAGLDVTIEELNAGENSFDSVLTGKFQFGVAGSDLIVKRAEGLPVVALAAIYQHSPLVFLTSKSTGIENIHQIAGKRVMLEEHSAELHAYLRSERIGKSSLLLYPHSYGVNELIAGEVDVISAYSNDEPFKLKEKDIDYKLFMPQSSGIDFYGDILYTTEDQVRMHPERVKNFRQASLKGWKYALENPEEVVDIIFSKYSQRHSRKHLLFEAEGASKLILPDVVEIGYMNPGRWANILERYENLKVPHQGIDFETFIYNPNPTGPSLIMIAIQVGEIFLALIAVWFIFRFVRINTSLEALDKKSALAKNKLIKSKRRFARLLDNLPGMSYKCKYDESWTMLFVSKGSYALTGYYPEEMLDNKAISYAEIILPEYREMVSEAVKNGFHRGETFKIAYKIKCKDGTVKWVWEQGRFVSSLTKLKNLRIEGFIIDITESKILEEEREKLIVDLQSALGEIKELRGILPICSSCKKIRDDKGYWKQIEGYIQQHTGAEFSHGLCPCCIKELYPEIDLSE